MIARAATTMLVVLTALALPATRSAAQPVLRNMELKSHFDDFPTEDYSACWSYIHGNGDEYAVIGTQTGTAFYNVTDPAAASLVGFIPGPPSDWREMKSYRNWVYIVTEGTGSGKGLQIVSMADPQNPVLVKTYTKNFVTSHTVSVDTARAILICNGTRANSGSATGMRVLSLANPTDPTELTWWPGAGTPVPDVDYIHDSEPIGNRLYGSSIYSGIQRVFDFTNPAAIMQIHQWTYPGAVLTHSAWPDASGNTLYVTDEVNGQTLRVFDISALTAPVLVNGFTSNPAAIVHNPRVVGNELYLANYSEGVRVLDITDPKHPAEFAYADSWTGASGGYFGVWEACPYFPSGTVIASDIQSGLYVYRVVRDYGIIRARVVDQATGTPLAGIKVYLTPQGDSLTTPADGVVQFAPNPGTHTVQAIGPAYPTGSATVAVTSGSRDTVTLAIPTGTLAGTVKKVGTLAALEDAEVNVGEVHAHTDATGQYAVSFVPEADYTVEVRAPGHIPVVFDRHIGPATGGQNFLLTPATTWDALETDLGWTVGATGDNATSGLWVRGDPVGTGAPQAPALADRTAGMFHARHPGEGEGSAPGDVQPENDRTPPPGVQCFMTGQNSPGFPVGMNDVDDGQTTLTSPTLDLSAMSDPVIGYWRWFYTRDADGSDWFAVQISSNGGAAWTEVEGTFESEAHWTERAIRVLDYVTPTSQVKVRFIAADLAPGGIVEATVDDVSTYENGSIPVGVEPPARPARLAWRAPWPNPAAGTVRLSLALPAAGDVAVEVLDLAGRKVRTLHRGVAAPGLLALRWDGTDERGAATPAGLYLVRATGLGTQAVTRVVRVRS